MYSDDEKVVLCGRQRPMKQKYYFNQDFSSLPQAVQDELHVMCVMFYRGNRRDFYTVV